MLRFRNKFTLVATVAKTQHQITRYHGNEKIFFLGYHTGAKHGLKTNKIEFHRALLVVTINGLKHMSISY